MKKKIINYVTISPEEDQVVISMEPGPPAMTFYRYIFITFMSVVILGVYIFMNHTFFPGYPVINTFAEKNEIYAEHYPPFRMNEWIYYSLTDDIISGSINKERSLSAKQPIVFSFLAVPLTAKFDEVGIYYTNAFILWLCSLVFFAIMIKITRFSLACASTFILAFATPNLFFAASAYCEPLGQLLLLLSVYFLIKGLFSNRELLFYFLCGLVVGMNIFVNPHMVLSVVFFAIVIFAERSEWSWNNKGVFYLFIGFCFSLVLFYIFYRLVFGQFSGNALIYFNYLNFNVSQYISDYNGNIIVGVWKLVFDSPEGLFFIMPFSMIVPLGIIFMWRKKMRSVSILTGTLILFAIICAAYNSCFITGESVGTRQLLSIIPLLVMPLAFVWEKEVGEKIWLVVTLLLTVYMCSFGWWAGTAREQGFFIGVLHDRNARQIILARKNMLGKPVFKSSNEIVGMFFDSLAEGDIKKWFQTLDSESIVEINGFERVIFNNFMMKNKSNQGVKELFIKSVDPDNGIKLEIPEINYSPYNPGDSIF